MSVALGAGIGLAAPTRLVVVKGAVVGVGKGQVAQQWGQCLSSRSRSSGCSWQLLLDGLQVGRGQQPPQLVVVAAALLLDLLRLQEKQEGMAAASLLLL